MAAGTKSGSGDLCAHPPVLEWAQRKDKLWITVALEDCSNPTHDVKGQCFYFKGKGGTENMEHEVTLELYGEIEKFVCHKTGRNTLFTLMKTEKSTGYWPRLTKDKKKLHFVKTDFGRWKDESDSSDDMDENQDFNLDAMMNSMGGLKGGEFDPGACEDEHDSDDEDLPDLQ